MRNFKSWPDGDWLRNHRAPPSFGTSVRKQASQWPDRPGSVNEELHHQDDRLQRRLWIPPAMMGEACLRGLWYDDLFSYQNQKARPDRLPPTSIKWWGSCSLLSSGAAAVPISGLRRLCWLSPLIISLRACAKSIWAVSPAASVPTSEYLELHRFFTCKIHVFVTIYYNT